MSSKGITLVELVVVLSVVVILIASAGFSYEKWMGNYRVEIETKELYADLMRARLMAMQRNRKHFVTTNEYSYTIFEDRNENGSPEPGEELPAYPRKVTHPLDSNSTASLSFNTRGMIAVPRTLHFNLDNTGLAPDYDCLKLSRSRMIMGKYNGAECTVN
jgi:Tfp pilus assembly protein FimT